jgi:hypothetical protein
MMQVEIKNKMKIFFFKMIVKIKGLKKIKEKKKKNYKIE